MLKKYIAVILSLVIMLSSAVSASALTGTFIDRFLDDSGEIGTGESNTDESGDVIQRLLYELGIFEEGKSISMRSDATYADFSYAVNVILGKNAAGMDEEQRIEVLKTLHIIKTEQPGQYVTLKELVYAAVELTGYGEYIRLKDSDFSQYYAIAQNKKLLHNIIYREGNATGAEMAQILFNILSVASLEIVGIENDFLIYEKPEKETILERRFDVVKKEGVLTAAYMTSMYSSGDLKSNQVAIDGEVYESSANWEQYVGRNVLAFVSEEDNILLAAEPKNNEAVEFSAEDLISYNNNEIEYYDIGEDSDEELEISLDTKLIYNNTYLGNYSVALFDTLTTSNTTFTAVDNNKDGQFDVITVWEYEHFPVLQNVSESGRITFRYGMKFRGLNYIDTLDVKDTTVLVRKLTPGGAEEDILPSTIKAGNVVSIAAGKNTRGEKYIKILVSTESINDTIITYDSEKHIVGFKNSQYKISKQYLAACGILGQKERIDVVTPELGGTYRFTFSADGLIADVTLSSEEDMPWGFLVDSATGGGGLTRTGMLKVFDGNRMNELNLAEELTYYDENYITGLKVSAPEAVSMIRSLNPEDPRYMIRYEVNADDEIKKLYMPIDKSTEKPGSFDYPNVIGFNGSGTYWGQMINTTYCVHNDRSTLFCVPNVEDASKDEEYYSMGFYEAGTQVSMEDLKLYGMDKFYDCPIGLWVGNAKTIGSDLPVAVVEKVAQAVNDEGEIVLRAFCYMSGKDMARPDAGGYTIVDFELDSVSTVETRLPSQIKATELKFGDIIQLQLSAAGAVNYFRVLLREENADSGFCMRGSDSEKIEGDPGYLEQDRITYHGKFCGSRNDMMLIDVGNDGNERILPTRYFAYNYIVLMDRESKKVSQISRSDISEGDTVFAVRRYAGTIVLVVIR